MAEAVGVAVTGPEVEAREPAVANVVAVVVVVPGVRPRQVVDQVRDVRCTEPGRQVVAGTGVEAGAAVCVVAVRDVVEVLTVRAAIRRDAVEGRVELADRVLVAVRPKLVRERDDRGPVNRADARAGEDALTAVPDHGLTALD